MGSVVFKFALENTTCFRITAPSCYKFDITIYFDNADHDGQVLLSLDAEAIRLKCKGKLLMFYTGWSSFN